MTRRRTATTDGYTVGYRRPPVEHQFKKGQSGNPGGRPRKMKVTGFPDLLRAELAKTVRLKINGVEKVMTNAEAAAARLANDLLTAPPRERLKLVQELEKLGVFAVPPEATISTPETRRAFLAELAKKVSDS